MPPPKSGHRGGPCWRSWQHYFETLILCFAEVAIRPTADIDHVFRRPQSSQLLSFALLAYRYPAVRSFAKSAQRTRGLRSAERCPSKLPTWLTERRLLEPAWSKWLNAKNDLSLPGIFSIAFDWHRKWFLR